ncbi:iron-hydroxamate transporter substrate-binding subunit [Klebsiella variicola]|uniref:Iron-hydroxamate transporter substrate-binding subunit n=1 Tax=Klebsiella variicola TaxID=244366 RepID=A0A7H4MDL9_KLEVA|nr:iron-hydroxamate transporter substrate-binding subunit [Klebsiella variicola]
MMNPTLITRRRLLTAMALSPLLWQMRGAQAANIDPQRVVALEWLPAELLLALGVTPYGVADIPKLSPVGERTRAARVGNRCRPAHRTQS